MPPKTLTPRETVLQRIDLRRINTPDGTDDYQLEVIGNTTYVNEDGVETSISTPVRFRLSEATGSMNTLKALVSVAKNLLSNDLGLPDGTE